MQNAVSHAGRLSRLAWLTAFCFPSTTQKLFLTIILSKTSICIIYDE